MRRVSMAAGLAVAVCALAGSAPAALAHSFTASIAGKELSEATPGKVKGIGIGSQVFKFGPVKIECEKATNKGQVTAESSATLKLTAKYGACGTAIKVGSEPASLRTRLVDPVEYVFHANGFAETGAEGEETSAEVGGGSVEWKIAGIKCLISWPSQTVPVHAIGKPELEYDAALFSGGELENTHLRQFPSGKQHTLLIKAEFKNMEFSFEEGQCSEFKHPEAKTGSFIGTVEEQLANGNIGWE
jgi:hypothetical protein